MKQVMTDSSFTCFSDDRQILPMDQVCSGLEFLLALDIQIFDSSYNTSDDEFPSTWNNFNFSSTT